MKKILYFFSLFLFMSVSYPQTYFLNVNFKNGTKVIYNVADINKIDFSPVTRLEDAQKLTRIIKSLWVLQNYPNPFNPSTTIQYEIPKAGEVEIHIFDLNGRVVKTMKNQHPSAGSYEVEWDGRNKTGAIVASGPYMYSVKFENSVVSKKMILIK